MHNMKIGITYERATLLTFDGSKETWAKSPNAGLLKLVLVIARMSKVWCVLSMIS